MLPVVNHPYCLDENRSQGNAGTKWPHHHHDRCHIQLFSFVVCPLFRAEAGLASAFFQCHSDADLSHICTLQPAFRFFFFTPFPLLSFRPSIHVQNPCASREADGVLATAQCSSFISRFLILHHDGLVPACTRIFNNKTNSTHDDRANDHNNHG